MANVCSLLQPGPGCFAGSNLQQATRLLSLLTAGLRSAKWVGHYACLRDPLRCDCLFIACGPPESPEDSSSGVGKNALGRSLAGARTAPEFSCLEHLSLE